MSGHFSAFVHNIKVFTLFMKSFNELFQPHSWNKNKPSVKKSTYNRMIRLYLLFEVNWKFFFLFLEKKNSNSCIQGFGISKRIFLSDKVQRISSYFCSSYFYINESLYFNISNYFQWLFISLVCRLFSKSLFCYVRYKCIQLVHYKNKK